MFSKYTRRDLLKTGAKTGGLFGLGNLGFLSQLTPVSAAETKLDPDVVRLQPEIEPLVRLIESTPRARLLAEVADRIHKGLSYRELLAALFLAGVKNVEPRPSVGFKFHTVLVVNSAHLASLASPAEHRWLPIFWALDYYKSAEAQDVKERGDWTMKAVDDRSVPAAHRAKAAFVQAMDNWDEQAADLAITGLARTASVGEIYELFVRYGVRDFRSIGHKAIYVANSFRTLQCIGWQHAEPVLRSLAYALISHEGDNPAKRDSDADRPFRANVELAKKFDPNWVDGKTDQKVTAEFLRTLRDESTEDACDELVTLSKAGAGPQTFWDALHVASGELLMRQPGIVALHAVTSTNALRYAYQTSESDESRRLLLLQGVAFVTMFREAMKSRGKIQNLTINDLEQGNEASDEGSVDEILAELSGDPMESARKLMRYLRKPADDSVRSQEFMNAARVLVFLKGNDAHDYKFSSAVMEDYYHVSPSWRDTYLASNIFKLCSSEERDNKLVERTRAALAS